MDEAFLHQLILVVLLLHVIGAPTSAAYTANYLSKTMYSNDKHIENMHFFHRNRNSKRKFGSYDTQHLSSMEMIHHNKRAHRTPPASLQRSPSIARTSSKSIARASPHPVERTTTVFSSHLAGPGLAAMFTPPPSFPNNDISPTFADTTPENVTVIRGRMAELKCAVQNLGTKSVSWVRHKDIHVLTVGRITFTNDGRFMAHNTPGSNVWSLRIKFPQTRDTGKYECQVSVRPPLSRVVQLNVVEPQAVMPPELFVDRGSPLNITCTISDSPEPPRNVFWYHQSKMVTFDGSRQGVKVNTVKGPITTSVLRIPDVQVKDSGIYICSPEGMKEASVTVTVLHGELPQAMQTGSTCRACFGSHTILLVIISCLVGLPYFLTAIEAFVATTTVRYQSCQQIPKHTGETEKETAHLNHKIKLKKVSFSKETKPLDHNPAVKIKSTTLNMLLDHDTENIFHQKADFQHPLLEHGAEEFQLHPTNSSALNFRALISDSEVCKSYTLRPKPNYPSCKSITSDLSSLSMIMYIEKR